MLFLPPAFSVFSGGYPDNPLKDSGEVPGIIKADLFRGFHNAVSRQKQLFGFVDTNDISVHIRRHLKAYFEKAFQVGCAG